VQGTLNYTNTMTLAQETTPASTVVTDYVSPSMFLCTVVSSRIP
jgi:hypothetical protein